MLCSLFLCPSSGLPHQSCRPQTNKNTDQILEKGWAVTVAGIKIAVRKETGQNGIKEGTFPGVKEIDI